MQKELQLLEQRWGLALQSAVFGIWDLDVAHQRVHYSPQWKALLGYGEADEDESTAVWRSRVHPDDLARMMALQVAHLEGASDAYECEFRLRAADGRYLWVLSRGRVVERDERGNALRMVGTLTDQTDRRDAEALRLERDRTEAARRAQTDFLARMSHEMRTPLNAVLGFAQLLGQRIGEPDHDDQRRCAAHIEEAGWQLLSMIEDALDLARIGEGHLPIQLGSVDLARLARGVCEDLREQASRRGVALGVPEVPAEALVVAHAGRLEQVLRSLVDNAIKFNRAGGRVDVAVRASTGDAAPGWTVSVADTGIGLSPAQLARLFEPFERLGREKHGTPGVGLGLVLSRWLVEAMGGRISACGAQDAGATFSVALRPASAVTPAAGSAGRRVA